MPKQKNNSSGDLDNFAKKIRQNILKTSYEAKACHIGSALSCVEILVSLYSKILKKDDVFLFSKASGTCALYAILAEKGIINRKKVAYFLKKYPLAQKEGFIVWFLTVSCRRAQPGRALFLPIITI